MLQLRAGEYYNRKFIDYCNTANDDSSAPKHSIEIRLIIFLDDGLEIVCTLERIIILS